VPILFRNHRARPAAPPTTSLLDDLAVATRLGASRLRTISERMGLVTERARYGSTAAGHYALNLPAYCHSTSPIRRYADLITQRQVTAALEGVSLPYSDAELTSMADWISVVADQWRADARARAADEDTDNPAVANTTLEANPALFSVAVAMAERAPSERMMEEVGRRAAAGELSIRDLAAVILAPSETWADVHANCMKHLEAHPADAMSVMAMLPQRHDTDRPEILVEQSEGGYRARASLRRAEILWRSGWVAASSKQRARHLAALALLRTMVGDDTPSGHESAEDSDMSVVITPAPPGNHKGKLQELAQQRGWAVPVYRVEQEGSPHSPIFSGYAEVAAEGRSVSAGPVLGRTRKAAEQAVAFRLLASLRDTTRTD
jgi:ribonuclease R